MIQWIVGVRRAVGSGWAALAIIAGAGCDIDSVPPLPDPVFPPPRDMAMWFAPVDLSTDDGPPEPCSAEDVHCHHALYGLPYAPFALSKDVNPDPLVTDQAVERDMNGALKLALTINNYNFLYIANTHDLADDGTISKLDTQGVREKARYFPYTCYSNPGGSSKACDGKNGCCAKDDDDRYRTRKRGLIEPDHQPIQKTMNLPSRTGTDFNGDLIVANQAPGGIASVTKIANNRGDCLDRNKNGKIDTSEDVDGNGWIEVDCNADGVPDDMAGVRQQPCLNGQKQEFYGADDECILWTTNVFASGANARAVALGPGAVDWGPSDAWVGSSLGRFERIDGTTGMTKEDVDLPADCSRESGPWGVAIDAAGFAWVTEHGPGKLCYFDLHGPNHRAGVVRDPDWGPISGAGLALDRDQNVWIGGAVARYAPERSGGNGNIGFGRWTRIYGATGNGIVADSRNVKSYFVWSCAGGNVLRIPASDIPQAKMDQVITNPGWPTIAMPCTGVEVDNFQDIWGIDPQLSTRARIDAMGNLVKPPDVNGMPMGRDKCPAGDSCPNLGAEVYRDFSGFGLRNYGVPSGSYSVLVRGCTDGNGAPVDTQWWSLAWDGDVPPNTTLTARTRTLATPDRANPSTPWTMPQLTSPIELRAGGANAPWLELEFTFKTNDRTASPKLKSVDVAFRCP